MSGAASESKVLVKICGITNEEDAVAAIEAGADALGFNFWPGSPRHVTAEKARTIVAALATAVLKVGVFVDVPESDAGRIVARAKLDVAQIHGPANEWAIRHWQALAAGPDLASKMEASSAEAFLIDAPAGEQRGGTGQTFDWDLLRGLNARIVLAGGLAPDNVADAIRRVRPWGVDACSRLESEPGRKDHAKMVAFVRAVREAEEL
jgi:phosphoribosylanthranilate isomerase